MSLSVDLQKLPPQALDVIRYLRTQEQGADVTTIMAGTGLSERAFGKAIRRLVTRHYVEMPAQGYYTLTNAGRQAAEELGEYDGSVPMPEVHAAPDVTVEDAAPVILHKRRLSVWVAQELVIRSGSEFFSGLDGHAEG
jgi:predicted transcriptional regulator